MTLANGQVLQNRYQIVSLIGQGGMGAAYLVDDLRLDRRRCVVKENIVDPFASPAEAAQLRRQFHTEASILAKLDHPNLPKVSDYFSDADKEYIVMDYVVGENLEQYLARSNKPLPERQVLKWAHQIMRALEYMHGNNSHPVVHRDIKPSNIILTTDEQIKLVDFGLVKLLVAEGVQTATVMKGLGTPEFAPLEQYASGQGRTDSRSDLYALGATLYMLLTGTPPPDVHRRLLDSGKLQPIRKLNPEISAQTESVVVKAMEIYPDKRFQTAAAMRQALPTVSDSGLIESSAHNRIGQRRTTGVVVAVAAGLVVVGLLVLFIAQRPTENVSLKGDSPSIMEISNSDPLVSEAGEALRSQIDIAQADRRPETGSPEDGGLSSGETSSTAMDDNETLLPQSTWLPLDVSSEQEAKKNTDVSVFLRGDEGQDVSGHSGVAESTELGSDLSPSITVSLMVPSAQEAIPSNTDAPLSIPSDAQTVTPISLPALTPDSIQMASAVATQLQLAVDLTLTAVAPTYTPTPTPTPIPTSTYTPNPTETAKAEATRLQRAVELTLTALAPTPTPTATATDTPNPTLTAAANAAKVQLSVEKTLTAVVPTSTPTPIATATPDLSFFQTAIAVATEIERSKGGTSPPPSPTTLQTPQPSRTPTPTPTSAPRPSPGPTVAVATQTGSSSNVVSGFDSEGSWILGDQKYGSAQSSSEQRTEGNQSLKLAYSNLPGRTVPNEHFIVLRRPTSLAIPGQPSSLTAQVYGDNGGHFLNFWISDAENELWQFTFGQIAFSGWRQVTMPLDVNGAWPVGVVQNPSNRRLDYPIKLFAIVLDNSTNRTASGAIYIDDLTIGGSGASSSTGQTNTLPTATRISSSAQAQPAQAPVVNLSPAGRIGYSAWRDGQFRIILVNASSGNAQEVFSGATQPDFCLRPANRIIANGTISGMEGTVAIDLGSQAREVIPNTDDSLPACAPEGQRVVFQSPREGGQNIWIHGDINVRDDAAAYKLGSSLTGRYPTWSSRWQIIWQGCNFWSGNGGDCGIWQVPDNGRGTPVRISSGSSDTAPDVSPDGATVAYMSVSNRWQVFTASANGGGNTQLTSEGDNGLPTWSPDGDMIAFVSNRDGRWGLWVMARDGSNQTKIAALETGFGQGGIDWTMQRISWGR